MDVDRLGEFLSPELRVGTRGADTAGYFGCVRRAHAAQPADLATNRKILLQDLAISPKVLAVSRPVSNLKLAIVASGRTQREIALAAGTDEYRLSRIVNERELPPLELRAAIATALGVPVGELWPAQPASSDQISADADAVGRREASAA